MRTGGPPRGLEFLLVFSSPAGAQTSLHVRLYAFARYTDDLADGCQPPDQKYAALASWRQQLGQALDGECPEGILPAVIDTVGRFTIPRQYLFDILDGVRLDVQPQGFETFDDLREYCYRVASAVGLACLHIWGFADREAVPLAIDRGIAFQLTNILRDIREDVGQHRLYLPREDLRRFDCSEADLATELPNQKGCALLQFEIDRAESYYRQSKNLASFVHPDGKRVLHLMTATYWQLLQKIGHRTDDVFRRRMRLDLLDRARIVNSALLPWGAIRRGKF